MNKTNIDKLEVFYKNIEKLKYEVDTEYDRVRTGAEDRKVKISRKFEDGVKEVEAKESDLWYEVQQLGIESETAKTLEAIYPKFFELVRANNKEVDDLNNFAIKEMGINPTKITLLDIIRIVEGVIEGRNETK